MRKLILFFCLVAAPIVVFALEAGAQEERATVFRDLAWGDPVGILGKVVDVSDISFIDHVPGLPKSVVILTEKTRDAFWGFASYEYAFERRLPWKYSDLVQAALYARPDEDLALGAISADSIVYLFLNGELAAVAVAVYDQERRLEDVLTQKYGPRKLLDDGWEDDQTIVTVERSFMLLRNKTRWNNGIRLLEERDQQLQQEYEAQVKSDAEAW